MSPRTVFLSKLIGLYCLLLAFTMLLNKAATMEAITWIIQNHGVMLVMGVFTLIAGVAMVLAHNVWRGGGVTVVVTAIGWLTLLKALMILTLPADVESRFLLAVLQSDQVFYIREVLLLVLGVYLTYGGFAACREDQTQRR